MARSGNVLLGWAIIDRLEVEPGSTRVGLPTLDAVTTTIARLGGDDFQVAMEDVLNPTGFNDGQHAAIRFEELLRTAEVLSHVRATYRDVVLVRPRKHGQHPLIVYVQQCPALVGPVEHRNAIRKHTLHLPAPEKSVLRHARSAWNIAGTATAEGRLQRALAGQPRPRRRPTVKPNGRKPR